MPKTIIVDSNDQIIGEKEKGTLVPGDLFRVSALSIKNSAGEILLSQRSHFKKHHPLKWGPAVEGTHIVGDTHESNIIRSLKNELGIHHQDFQKIGEPYIAGTYKHFHQWLQTTIDKEISDFEYNTQEIENIKWFTLSELRDEIVMQPGDYLVSLEDVEMLSK